MYLKKIFKSILPERTVTTACNFNIQTPLFNKKIVFLLHCYNEGDNYFEKHRKQH